MEVLQTIGVGGILGLLVGIFFAAWVGPTTAGGFGLLVVICVGVGVLSAALIKLLSGKRPGDQKDKPGSDPKAD